MNRSHILLRALTNLSLSRSKIISEFTEIERGEIANVNKPAFFEGAVGEFGIRKALPNLLDIRQNLPKMTGQYWWDWYCARLETYIEVKSQPWWGTRIELVLGDNNSGRQTNFREHYKEIDSLLVWSIKPDGDTITPLALVDPSGIMDVFYNKSDDKGIAANVRTLHEKGYLVPLNDEWKYLLLQL